MRSRDTWRVPMAAIPAPKPRWPLPNTKPRFSAQSLGYRRPFTCTGSACKRWHAGVDLTGAAAGAPVIAAEDCVILGLERAWTPSTRQIFARNHSTFAVYGGFTPGSSQALGLREGATVAAGAPLGKIAAGYNMLHFELYDGAAPLSGNQRWWRDEAPPTALLNPTNYLQAAAGWPITRETSPQRHLTLAQLGHYAGPIEAPWTDISEAALKNAQKALGLAADGVWGPSTEEAIRRALGEPSTFDSAPRWSRGIQAGLGAIGLLGFVGYVYFHRRRA